MSVLKSKRKESKFEVFNKLTKLRKEITDYLLRDFGYSFEKAEKRLEKMFGDKKYEELNDKQKEQYDKTRKRNEAFDAWFIITERNTIADCLRDITKEVYIANSIYPKNIAEYEQRRLHQDEAIGQCNRLSQELQYIIETLPVNINNYTKFDDLIQDEINLIKAWRKSDNKFLRAFPDTSTNFCNANGNGNANCNNSSNVNGVRPRF